MMQFGTPRSLVQIAMLLPVSKAGRLLRCFFASSEFGGKVYLKDLHFTWNLVILVDFPLKNISSPNFVFHWYQKGCFEKCISGFKNGVILGIYAKFQRGIYNGWNITIFHSSTVASLLGVDRMCGNNEPCTAGQKEKAVTVMQNTWSGNTSTQFNGCFWFP